MVVDEAADPGLERLRSGDLKDVTSRAGRKLPKHLHTEVEAVLEAEHMAEHPKLMHRVDAARKIIRSLNADAEIIETDHSDVKADKILDTKLFNLQKAHEHPMWAKELYGFADHVPETEEYGVTSFVYRARLPFVTEKIEKLLNGSLPGVIRAKGQFWIASRPDWVLEFSLAGALSSVSPMGQWWATVPEEERQQHENVRNYLKENWHEPWGDRRLHIVLIGS